MKKTTMFESKPIYNRDASPEVSSGIYSITLEKLNSLDCLCLPNAQRTINAYEKNLAGIKLVVYLWTLLSRSLKNKSDVNLVAKGFKSYGQGFFNQCIFAYDVERDILYIIDGHHRIVAIQDFFSGTLRLPTSLGNYYPDAERWAANLGLLGKTFNELSPALQAAIRNSVMFANILSPNSSEMIAAIFAFANGGKQVKRSEIVNAIHCENEMLKKLRALYSHAEQWAREPWPLADDSDFTAKEMDAFAFMAKNERRGCKSEEGFLYFMARTLMMLNHQDLFCDDASRLYSLFLDLHTSTSEAKSKRILKDLAKKVSDVSGFLSTVKDCGRSPTMLTGLLYAIHKNVSAENYKNVKDNTGSVTFRSKDEAAVIAKKFRNKKNWAKLSKIYDQWFTLAPEETVPSGDETTKNSAMTLRLTTSTKLRKNIELPMSFVSLIDFSELEG